MNMMHDSIYIVGGGPSLKGFDFSQLLGLNTIAVNMSALDVPKPTYCITADSGIFAKVQRGLFKGVETTWVLVTNPNHCTLKFQDGKFVNTKTGMVMNPFCMNMVIRNAGTDGIGFTWDDFKTGYNSGFCAFQFAVLMGYQKIYLLGIDLNDEDPESHYHKYYSGRSISKQDLSCFASNFKMALEIVQRNTSIQVASCSARSVLNSVIPYKPFDCLDRRPPIPVPPKEIDVSKIKVQISRVRKDRLRLSILICSLSNRKAKLNTLLDSLFKQQTPEVEIIVAVDSGEAPTGTKRNILLTRALGQYVAFVDDDDQVSPLYVSQVLKALKTNPDCADLWGEIMRRGFRRTFTHSIQHDGWFEKGGTYYRCPNHLNAVKRELAMKVRFPDVSRGEDRDYSLRLRPLLNTEGKTETVIYYYLAD